MASRVNCRFGRINLNLPSCEKSQHGAADTNKSTCMCDLEESYPFTTQNASVQSCSGREIFYGSVFGREGVGDDTTEATESFGGLHRRAQDPPDHHPHGRRGRWLDNVFIDRLWRSVPYAGIDLRADRTPGTLRTGLAPSISTPAGAVTRSWDRGTPDAVYFSVKPRTAA